MSSEQIRKRRANEAALLRELHYSGSMRRGELSSNLGIRKSSVSNIVADFLERGVLTEDRPGALRSRISLDSSHYRVVVGHVEPTLLRLAEVSCDGAIHNEERIELEPGLEPEPILGTLAEHIRNRKSALPSESVVGIGVAVPGITDPAKGFGVHAINMTGWKNLAVGKILKGLIGEPVAIENDVRCQLLGNAWFRKNVQSYRNILYVSLQLGVACAAMVDGRALLGRRFAAGEIGCLRAGEEGRKCACGKTDCLQTYVGAPAIIDSIKNLRPQASIKNLGDLSDVAEADPSVLIALDQVVAPLAPILAAAASILDPDIVLLASDDVSFSEKLRPLVELRLNRELLGLYTQGVNVVAAENAEDATLRGMASVLIRAAFQNGFAVMA